MTPFLTQIFLLSNNLSATPTNTVIDIAIVCLGDCSIAGLTHDREQGGRWAGTGVVSSSTGQSWGNLGF